MGPGFDSRFSHFFLQFLSFSRTDGILMFYQVILWICESSFNCILFISFFLGTYLSISLHGDPNYLSMKKIEKRACLRSEKKNTKRLANWLKIFI